MVKQFLSVICLAGLGLSMVGCGGAATEIKPTTKSGEMTPEQKKHMEQEIQKSMERNKNPNRPQQ